MTFHGPKSIMPTVDTSILGEGLTVYMLVVDSTMKRSVHYAQRLTDALVVDGE